MNEHLQGYRPDPRERDSFLASQPVQRFSMAGPKGQWKGKRAILWNYYRTLDRKAYTEVQTGPDCTSHGSRNALDTSRAVGIATGRSTATWVARTATEPTYGARGDCDARGGMSPARASRWLRDVGYLSRLKYDAVDLSTYNFEIGRSWCRGVPDKVKSLCEDRKAGTITSIEAMDDLFDALFNGYGVHSGQSAGWSATPNGIYHPRSRDNWGHDMQIGGYDDTRTHWPYTAVFIMQSWSPDWNEPVKDWPADLPPPVPGMIVSKAEDAEVCVDSKDCWAISDVVGYPPTVLPDMGTIGMLSK